MKSSSWRSITGWSGVAFVAVFLLSEMSLADTPALDESASAIRQWFEANADQIGISQWGAGLAIGFFFLLFASGLRSHLGPADAFNEGVWTRVWFGGAVALVAIAGAHSGFWAVLSQKDILSTASDELVKTLGAFESVMLTTVIAFSIAVALFSASVVILQSRVMARWLGWLGMTTALLFAVGSLWPITGDQEGILGFFVLAGFVGWLLWTLGASVGLIRSGSSVDVETTRATELNRM